MASKLAVFFELLAVIASLAGAVELSADHAFAAFGYVVLATTLIVFMAVADGLHH